MIEEYVLSCCSTVDLTPQFLALRNIAWVPFHFELDGISYRDDMGQSMSYPAFYQAMLQGADTKTSQVNVQEYLDHFESFLLQGKDILHVCFSSGLSGTFNSAQIAANMLSQKYPNRSIFVVDSLCASSGYGLLMDKLASLRDKGMPIAELAVWTEANRLKVNHWFFSTDLKFYVKGGRVSKTAGLVGTALRICPLLTMDKEGKLAPYKKIRTKRVAIEETLLQMIKHAENATNYSGKVFICHSECLKDAQTLAGKIEKFFPHLEAPVEIFYVGTTIGSHTGPGTVSLFFWGDARTA